MVDGQVKAGFEAVRDVFAETFLRRHELALSGDPRELALRNSAFSILQGMAHR